MTVSKIAKTDQEEFEFSKAMIIDHGQEDKSWVKAFINENNTGEIFLYGGKGVNVKELPIGTILFVRELRESRNGKQYGTKYVSNAVDIHLQNKETKAIMEKINNSQEIKSTDNQIIPIQSEDEKTSFHITLPEQIKYRFIKSARNYYLDNVDSPLPKKDHLNKFAVLLIARGIEEGLDKALLAEKQSVIRYREMEKNDKKNHS